MLQSLPAWGAWVEICSFLSSPFLLQCRSPHGERGLKFDPAQLRHGMRVAPRMGSVG